MKSKSEWSNFHNLSPGTNLWPAAKGPSVDKEETDVGNLSAV